MVNWELPKGVFIVRLGQIERSADAGAQTPGVAEAVADEVLLVTVLRVVLDLAEDVVVVPAAGVGLAMPELVLALEVVATTEEVVEATTTELVVAAAPELVVLEAGAE